MTNNFPHNPKDYNCKTETRKLSYFLGAQGESWQREVFIRC